MLDKSIIPYLWYAHGLYNTFVFLLFIWQGWFGLKIRIERITGRPPATTIIMRHRKFGPIMTLLGIAGFVSGLIITYSARGHIFEYPLHFIVGSVISILTIAIFLISRKIKGRESPWRTAHFVTGMMIICLYIVQMFLGIRILF